MPQPKRNNQGRQVAHKQGRPIAAARWQRLAEAIWAAPAVAKPRSVSHADCEAMLEFLVDAEMQGQSAPELYPGIWAHLESCPECHLSYSLLKTALGVQSDALQPEANSDITQWLPFLAKPDPASRWTQQIRSRVGGAPPGIVLTLSQPYAASLLRPSYVAEPTRLEASAPFRNLAVADTLTWGSHTIDVQMWVRGKPDTRVLQLEIHLRSTSGLPRPIAVRLTCAGHGASAPVCNGVALLSQVPVADWQSADRVCLEFDQREIPPACHDPAA